MHIFHHLKIFIFSTVALEIMSLTSCIQARTYILKVFGEICNLQNDSLIPGNLIDHKNLDTNTELSTSHIAH